MNQDLGKSREPMPGLGRVIIPDERDNNYLLSTLLAGDTTDLRSLRSFRHYKSGPPLNQGSTSHCVAYAWVQWLMSAPTVTMKMLPDTSWVYREAQLIDEWPGEEPQYYGTSVRAGVKVLQKRGHVESYHWTKNVNETAAWILEYGTIVLGTYWYTSMDAVDKNGVAKIVKGSPTRGGHAYLCVGYNQNMGAFRCLNSWGRQWGDGGRFWLLGEDLDRLFREYGEACAAIERVVQ